MSLEDIAWDSVRDPYFSKAVDLMARNAANQRRMEIEAATIAGFEGALKELEKYFKTNSRYICYVYEVCESNQDGTNEILKDMKEYVNGIYPNIHWD